MSNIIEQVGHVCAILEPRTFQSGSTLQTVVITWMGGRDGDREEFLACECWNKAAERVSALQVGEMVKVAGAVSSRESNGRWYTSARCWRVDPMEDRPDQAAPDQEPTDTTDYSDEQESMPF